MRGAQIERHLAAAAQAQSLGKAAEARSYLEQAARLDPADLRVCNELGLDALESGNAAAAIEQFGAAVAADASMAELWMNLAMAQRLASDDLGERQSLEQVLTIDQQHLMARIRLAELHERRAELAAATAHWVTVISHCSQIPQWTPEIAAVVAHARAFVGERQTAMVAAVDNGLAQALAAASERDRRRASAAADYMLGRRERFTNDCHGFFYPFLPADEFFDRGDFPWFKRLEAATAVVRDELLAILASDDPGLAPYIDMPPGTARNLWTDLDRSPDWSALHLWRDGERVDAVCERAPRTAELVESLPLARIPGRAPAVFFSILKAGKTIPPHTGVTNIRTIIHLPLIVPRDCGFRVGGETREWREGEAFAFDDTIEHEAWNRSDQDRALLILDCWNPHLGEDERDIVLRLFAISAAHNSD